ncbi:hypothetical protein DPEC_G00106720 [Dallia pectoralis]|uniref:Uncharacterized protein n=1 Tax=Dallia pectoralis TaxID=75939 RepID=A0ACC2GYR9_DALPE|nr:hypothetical protein DPEC_G00106720 [Dallia pectoralis]
MDETRSMLTPPESEDGRGQSRKTEGRGKRILGHVKRDPTPTPDGESRNTTNRSEVGRTNTGHGKQRGTRCWDDAEEAGFSTWLRTTYNDAIKVTEHNSVAWLNQSSWGPCSGGSVEMVTQPTDATSMGIAALADAITAALAEVSSINLAAAHRGRQKVKVGRYDGSTVWETYWTQFKLIASANQWSDAESAMQLAAVLEGEARRLLLDLTAVEMTDPLAIARAIERQFGEPMSSSAARFNERGLKDGEKLGVYAAELRHLARKAFPEFQEQQRSLLAKEAFISGLTPHALRQQVRLNNPGSWEEALERAQEVEYILGEGRENIPQQRWATPPEYHQHHKPRVERTCQTRRIRPAGGVGRGVTSSITVQHKMTHNTTGHRRETARGRCREQSHRP